MDLKGQKSEAVFLLESLEENLFLVETAHVPWLGAKSLQPPLPLSISDFPAPDLLLIYCDNLPYAT